MKRKTTRLSNLMKILVPLAVIGGSIWFIEAQVRPDWPGIGEWLVSNILIVVGAIVLVPLFVVLIIYSGQCPKCRKFWALRRTGATRGKSWISWGEEEFRCVHCGHKVWESARRYFAGGG